MKDNVLRAAASAFCLAVATFAQAADPSYSVTELKAFTRATDINNQGDIVGWRLPGQGILLRNGQSQVQNIGSLGGAFTYPRAVNDYVQVVGESMLRDNFTYHAFLYSNGVMRDLGTLNGHVDSGASDINVKGQVVGWSKSGSEKLPFIYSNGRMTAIEAIGGLSAVATAINDRGQVVGNAEFVECDGVPPTVTRAFRYSSLNMLGLPGLGGNNAEAFGINSNSWVVGTAEPILDNPLTHAFVWGDAIGGGITDLGTLAGLPNSVAKGVNKNGQIIGYSFDANDTPESRRAFIYLSGWMFDLNGRLATTGWLIREAIAINDNGQIIAEGCDTTQARCGLALLLDPITATKPPRRR